MMHAREVAVGAVTSWMSLLFFRWAPDIGHPADLRQIQCTIDCIYMFELARAVGVTFHRRFRGSWGMASCAAAHVSLVGSRCTSAARKQAGWRSVIICFTPRPAVYSILSYGCPLQNKH
jgi:hypothetical protein